jgi:hypothetical protein
MNDKPVWTLIYPEVARDGATIKLPVANGWPAASLPLDHAEMLGKQLLKAVAAAKRDLAAPEDMKGWTTDHEEADRGWAGVA